MSDPRADGSTPGRPAYHSIRYGSVWEDADVLCEALAPVAAGGRVLSVSSAGDNALALLTLDPKELVAVDVNQAQLSALALRIAAFRAMERPALLAFLGVSEDQDRLATYAALRPALPSYARAFWDAHPDAVAAGVIHAGRFERYLRVFRRRVLPLVHSRERVQRLLELASIEEQERFYRDEWDSWRWRVVFRRFVNRFVLGRLGRDRVLGDRVEDSVGDRVLERTRHLLTAVPVRGNPYLTYLLTGNYSPDALPRYLRAEHVGVIRERLERVFLVRGPAESAHGPFHALNLSDIFESMDEAAYDRTWAGLLNRAPPGALVAYWNMLVSRGPPPSVAARVRPLDDVARRLHDRDRAWIHHAFHLDEVTS